MSEHVANAANGRFVGQVAIVTGAAGGLGEAYAEALGREGATVVIGDIDGPAATRAAARLVGAGIDAVGVEVDVADEHQVQHLVDVAIDRGGVDILVNNAAIMFRRLAEPRKPCWEYTVDEWSAVLAVNVIGSWLCARAVLEPMRARGRGKIVNISSNMALGTDLMFPAGMSAYTTSKAAVLGLTKALAGELGVFGITVNAVAPGVTATETVLEHIAADRLASSVSTQAIRRVATTGDIVGAVLFLCSAESDFMTGQTVVVDGGLMST
jgi:3-oxoacyl-[acyl-carrier protein] reductase